MKIITIAVLAAAIAATVPLGAQSPPPKTAQAPSASAKATADKSADTTAAVLADFGKRVAAYAALRKSAEKGPAQLERHRDPAKIEAERLALAARIRTARATAKVGDIFTLQSRPVFRRLLTPPLKGADGKENKAAILDDNPGNMTLRVNQPYPKAEPLSSVPPDILKALPVLPEDIEYRFVGKHLILYDNRSGLILDYIPNAIP
jgi:hypothetical protein